MRRLAIVCGVLSGLWEMANIRAANGVEAFFALIAGGVAFCMGYFVVWVIDWTIAGFRSGKSDE